MSVLALVRPSVASGASFLEAVRELPEADQNQLLYTGEPLETVERDLPAYVRRLLDRETAPVPPLVPDTISWAAVGDRIVGRLSFRHVLNDFLRQVGGHIGYAVRPSDRGRGYAAEMLRRALATERARGIGELLVTCSEDNGASIRVIIRHGGVLSGHHDSEDGTPRTLHLWIRAS